MPRFAGFAKAEFSGQGFTIARKVLALFGLRSFGTARLSRLNWHDAREGFSAASDQKLALICP